jgi:3-oxoadipate enol-lactonase
VSSNAYTLAGNPRSARRAALVHSLAMDREFWRPVAERMDAAVLLYDCTGHGASPMPQGPYSVEGFADDLARLLDELAWPSALVAGASMGGCVALAFAGRHRQRLSALGLIDTTAWYGADAPRQWEERAQRALRDGMKALVDFQVTRWFSDAFRAAHPEVVARCVATFLANDVRAYAESCRMLGAADLRAVLPAIDVPTAIVVGEEDYATPLAMAEALHRGIRRSGLAVLTGARHLTPLERPDEIAAQLGALLDPLLDR